MPKELTPDQEQAKAAALQRIKDDPFAYSYVSAGLDLLLTLSARYPEYLPYAESLEIFSKQLSETAVALPLINPVLWDKQLRQRALLRVRQLCNDCQQCALAANRIPLRGGTFGEGVVDADLLVCAEGPGNLESRTGPTPLVDSDVLRTSTCATVCQHFEACYLDHEGQFVREPTRPCQFTPVTVSPEQRKDRLRKRNEVNSAGEKLGPLLKKAKFVRRAYVQVLKMAEAEGIVPAGTANRVSPNTFVTNVVRCRSCSWDAEKNKNVNTIPTTAHLDACRPWTQIIFALVQPKAILALGAVALKGLQADLPIGFKISEACANNVTTPCIVPLPDRRQAFVGLHPAGLMRTENVVIRDAQFRKLGDTIRQIAESLTQTQQESQTIADMFQTPATTTES